MPVTIAIPAPLRQFAGGQSQIEVDANTAGEALDRLTSTHAALRRHLFNDQNALRNFVNVYLNDEDIRHKSGPETPVKDGDTLMIVPSIAGGAVIEEEVGHSLPELSNEEIMRYSRHSSCRKSECRDSAN
jgi:adenylyltransferase/sulfurtransferase